MIEHLSRDAGRLPRIGAAVAAAPPDDLLTDDTHLYWVDAVDANVAAIRRANGSRRRVRKEESHAAALAGRALASCDPLKN